MVECKSEGYELVPQPSIPLTPRFPTKEREWTRAEFARLRTSKSANNRPASKSHCLLATVKSLVDGLQEHPYPLVVVCQARHVYAVVAA